jgi:hypothetical protein
MSPRSRGRSDARRASRALTLGPGVAPRPRRTALLIGFALAASLLLAACGQAFDPTGPCTADGSAPGAYPELEASVPKALAGAPPKELDSGRACTPAGLGTLAGHGVTEFRFAGATWERGNDSGVSLAIFSDPDGPPLEPAWVAEFYEAGARAASKVDSVAASDYSVDDTRKGRRIDVLNDESYQTIVVFQRNGQVAIALVANAIRRVQTKEAHEVDVRTAVDAFGA